jgi:hypothetical protein
LHRQRDALLQRHPVDLAAQGAADDGPQRGDVAPGQRPEPLLEAVHVRQEDRVLMCSKR